MRAGTLDRRVTIQRKSQTQSPSGEPIDAWANVVLRRPASMWPVDGSERYASPEEVAGEQIEFRVRYSADVAALNPKDRVIYPALSEAQAADQNYVIPERSIHDVLAVLEINRREGLKIITNRRPDVST
ncbi:head-tail adaptor protein [Tardiphaga sp. 862_B3_N1_1]|uniref:head-tail adaptor protein n=1 Tax=Tardiphaga sp. 862_B3_N1_1 TaxID=3240763 RepID=UPI003F8CA95B